MSSLLGPVAGALSVEGSLSLLSSGKAQIKPSTSALRHAYITSQLENSKNLREINTDIRSVLQIHKIKADIEIKNLTATGFE